MNILEAWKMSKVGEVWQSAAGYRFQKRVEEPFCLMVEREKLPDRAIFDMWPQPPAPKIGPEIGFRKIAI